MLLEEPLSVSIPSTSSKFSAACRLSGFSLSSFLNAISFNSGLLSGLLLRLKIPLIASFSNEIAKVPSVLFPAPVAKGLSKPKVKFGLEEFVVMVSFPKLKLKLLFVLLPVIG